MHLRVGSFQRHAAVLRHVTNARAKSCSPASTLRLHNQSFLKTAAAFSDQAPARKHAADPALYDAAFKRSLENPEEFWAEAADNLVWHKKWTSVLDNKNPPFTKWFSGGEISMCYNAVDHHVDSGFGDQTAIIHDSPMTNSITKISFRELMDQVATFAGVLRNLGVEKGDRVLIYMPMIPQAMVAMLATARLGAIHALVFGGFASKELSTRINHNEPKVIVSANCGMEPGRVVQYKPLLDRAIEMSEFKPKNCVIFNRDFEEFPSATMIKDRDVCWHEEMSKASPQDPVPVPAMDPLYCLYTSGTTGLPKAVVRPTGGHAVVLKWSMSNVYDVKPRETWFAASDLGWVVGHSYIVYAPLLNGNTTVLYEGKPVATPDAGAFYRMIQDHNVASMFTAPTAIRAIRREDAAGVYAQKYSRPQFRSLFIAGEHCDPETLAYIKNHFKAPALDNWWQTETGSAITSTCVGLGNNLYPPPGVAGKPVPGWNLKVIKDDGSECEAEELGNIVAKLPMPPGNFSGLWKNEAKFAELYFSKFPGYYDTMDAGFQDKEGNIAVMARTDDVINVAGHRLSSGQLEEALISHPDVLESAVVPLEDELKGHVPVGLCVLRPSTVKTAEELEAELIQTVRDLVGAVASFKKVILVQRLPKTRSGKIARGTMVKMLEGKPYKIPVTIEDPTVYDELRVTMEKAGYHPVDSIE